MSRPLHSDFRFLLELKEKSLINLYTGLREFILDLNPDANELLYHTHAPVSYTHLLIDINKIKM